MPIKVMIVDDEAIERTALKKIIERGIPGVSIVGEAGNGSEAVQLAHELEPDLILMDIQMPGLSGIEAIRQILERQPLVKFVMVTAYDTFDYARQALQLGVKDYLLKPCKIQEIVSMLQNVVGVIEQERAEFQQHAAEREKLQYLLPVVEADLVTQLLFDHVHDLLLGEMLRLLPDDAPGSFFVIVVNVIPALSSNAAPAEADAVVTRASVMGSGELYKIIKAQIRAATSGWIGPMSAWQIPVVVFKDAGQSYRLQAVSIVRRLLQLSFTLAEYKLFIGIGGLYRSLDDVRSSYHEALLASANLAMPAKHHFYEAAERQSEPLMISNIEKQLIEEARRGNWLNVEHELLQLIHQYETAKADIADAQIKVHELLFVLSRFMLELGIQAEPQGAIGQSAAYPQLKALAAVRVQALAKAFLEAKQRLAPDTMQRIKMYIREHAHEDISLEAVAEHVQLSPFYVSKMFKEQIGANYIDYLTECRMEHAKRLLSDAGKSLKEIAYEVGYKDPNYFSRVFKKSTGLSPSDYRKDLVTRTIK
ncbi:response regulator [Paenibacillus thalictri]|uniref:Response regulator n=1 Tax=Paenibacillus thalictri TaxID=2527873 RepID=A0A4Q9DXL0_9BACL|nr:response regulator [Paenibacillus thalictri]TBL81115.1 response regulator [Paenibacillus thalictri]